MSFKPLSNPESPLAIHRQLAPVAGVKVSPLCLGGMSFGDAWSEWMGTCDKKTTFEILDYFYQQGGNFIDTANLYQNEESESWIGEWMKARGNRDEIVIATKFTTGYKSYESRKIIQSNYGGMHTKSLKHSLEASLKKLQTDYIDLLYVHWWDYSTEVPELMHALNDVVQQGKVLYLGISDTPAWIVAKANQYARDHGLRPFVVYQGRWNAAARDFERDIIPMCRSEGMSIAPWGALGGGLFKTKEQREQITDGRKSRWPLTDDVKKICEVLEGLAKKKDTVMTSIAQAYVMHKYPYVYPIVGCRTLNHLKANIEALKIELSREEIDEIEKAISFDLGFPGSFAAPSGTRDVSGVIGYGDVMMNQMYGVFAQVDFPQPIKVSEINAKLSKEQGK